MLHCIGDLDFYPFLHQAHLNDFVGQGNVTLYG
jgi:hypothetical protein